MTDSSQNDAPSAETGIPRTRREFLWQAGGVSAASRPYHADEENYRRRFEFDDPLASKGSHFPEGNERHSVFCPGGLSHVDVGLWAELERQHGQPFDVELGKRIRGIGGNYAKSFWDFHPAW